MPRKTLIASLLVLAAAVFATPAGAADVVCPPGVTDASYCATLNESGLESKEHSTKTSNDSTVDDTVTCVTAPDCEGTLLFETINGKASSRAHTSKSIIYGSTHYSIADGKTATLVIKLDATGRRALERTGKLTVNVVSISPSKVRSVIGRLTIKGRKITRKAAKKKAKHVTKATEAPGFTG